MRLSPVPAGARPHWSPPPLVPVPTGPVPTGPVLAAARLHWSLSLLVPSLVVPILAVACSHWSPSPLVPSPLVPVPADTCPHWSRPLWYLSLLVPSPLSIPTGPGPAGPVPAVLSWLLPIPSGACLTVLLQPAWRVGSSILWFSCVPCPRSGSECLPVVYWPFVCVPQRKVCSDLGLISELGYVFFTVELCMLGLDLSPSPEQQFAEPPGSTVKTEGEEGLPGLVFCTSLGSVNDTCHPPALT